MMKELVEPEGKVVPTPKYDPNSLQDMLPVYYKRLFPHKPFYRWLSYGLSEVGIFTNREISFTLGDDIYIRYLCYDTQSQLEKDICARNPLKIDIGAVFQNKPTVLRMSSKSMVPVQRELVFDIDMTDYDDVRTCCEGADVCLKCWKFMTVACKVLDSTLREDFGFEHILWVFSGRRGIHCWICDHSARHLDTRGRAAVAEYMQLVTHTVSGDNNSTVKAVIGDRMHHSIKRALKIIEPIFEEVVLEDQNLFGTTKGIAKLLQMIPDENARKDTEVHLKKYEGATSKTIWTNFTRFTSSMRSQSTSNAWSRKMKNIVEEIQLAIMYPRLDINVTKGFNHLLKAPFCIHPSTGKLCVPFNPNLAAKFDPTAVPTIVSLMEEINAFDEKSKEEDAPEDKSRIKDFKKTGMFKPVVVFEEFLRKIEKSYKMKAIEIFFLNCGKMSHVKTLDALDMEFQYYSCLIKDLILLLPTRCNQYMTRAWFQKLSEPLYNAQTLREKRNHYLLMLTICMTLDGLKYPFNKYPPVAALMETTCIQNPKKLVRTSRCEAAKEANAVLEPCPLHNTGCPKDKDNIGKVLDEQFKFLINLAEPHVSELSDPSDRRRGRKWINFLSKIKSECFRVKEVRNDYAMLLSGYLMNEELPGPFIQSPIEKVIPLEDLVKTVNMNNHMVIDPSHPKTLKFFKDVPHPNEGAFAFIAVSGEICESFMRRK